MPAASQDDLNRGNTTTNAAAPAKEDNVPASDSPRPEKAAGMAPLVYSSAQSRLWRNISRRILPSDVEHILEGALNGDPAFQAELFDLMEDTWPRLRKNLNEVRRAVSSIKWQVEPYAEKGGEPSPTAKEKASLVEAALLRMRPDPARFENGMEETIFDILDSFARGISVLEIYWDKDGTPWTNESGGIGPRATKYIPAKYYAFPTGDTDDRLMLNLEGKGYSNSCLTDFPPNKFIIAMHRSKSGHPANSALLRTLAKYWIGATFGFQWLCNYAQTFGQPLRWATYDPNNTQLLSQITDMLENLGSAGWGAFPIGTTLDIKEASKSAADNPQAFLMDVADKACDILILGQTLTTDVGSSGSRALGQTHNTVRLEVISGSASFVARVLNEQLVPAILALNYGETSEAPSVVLEVGVPEDEVAKANRDKVLFGDLGLPVTKKYLYERHGVPAPVDGDELFEPKAPPPPPGFGAGEGGVGKQVAVTGDGKPSPASNDGEPDPADKKDLTEARAALSSPALIEARRTALNERLTNTVLEDVTGVAQAWLGPVKPIFRSLMVHAMDGTVSDKDFIAAIEAASARMPELFDELKTDRLAEALERAMGAAAVNGAVNGFQARQGDGRAA